MAGVRKVFDFVLYARGVYGRNRTDKPTKARLFRVEEGGAEPTTDAIDAAVAKALADVRFKRGWWYVDRNPVELDTRDDGVTWEKFLLYSGSRVAQGSVE